MDGTFNGQILVEKLAKLNNSQQSIETLSHWCIFHRKKAKQVVETWDRQFRCSPREQRVSFLYLANDILQNSRRKGFEFVGEFWKVLPDALNDVFKNGDESGRNVVSRLVDIWDERKVFGSRGQALKEEILGRNVENGNNNGKVTTYKLKNPCGDILEKLISSYEHVHGGPVDEDILFGRCQTAINYIEKMEKEIGGDFTVDVEELQGQHGVLRECIEQLMAAESSRATLASLLSEAIREQETKIEQIRSQILAAQSRYEQVGINCQQLLNCNVGQSQPAQRPKQTASVFSDAPPNFSTDAQASNGERVQSTPIEYIQQVPFGRNSSQTEEEHRKMAAAAVAAKLAASTSSAQMLSYVLSSLASEGMISQSAEADRSSDSKRPKLEHSSDSKRPKLENGIAPFIPFQPQPPPPPYPHPDSLHQPPPPQPSSSSMMQPSYTNQPPPALPPTMPHMSLPPPSSTQYMQTAGSMTSIPYTYGSALPSQRPPPMPGYSISGMPPYLESSFQSSSEGGLYNQPPPPTPPPPITQQ